MEIHVSQIDEYDGLVVDYTYPAGEPSLLDGEEKPEEGEENEGQVVGPTQVKVRASREGEDVLLRGQIQTAVQFACDRCLASFRTPLTQDFDLLYVSTPKSRNAHEEHELKEDDLSLSYYEGHVINLDDLVREQIELTLPMTHICSGSVPRALFAVWGEPQRRSVRLRRSADRPAMGRAQGLETESIGKGVFIQCQIRNANIQNHAPAIVARTTT